MSVRTAARALGELLITLGVLALLFVVYELAWTNVSAARAQDEVSDQLRERWSVAEPAQGTQPADDGVVDPSEIDEGDPATLEEGRALALLHVPALGDGWTRPVVEGVTTAQLARGVGHYPGTALPGQVGNVSYAGHRATNGEPFKDLDVVRAGDAVVVETGNAWYTYTVDADPVIVEPTAVEVVAPVPGQPGAVPTERKLTLTTCHPRWGSKQRLVVHATLSEVRTHAAGPPPAIGGA